jgi:oligosaccharide reducing-end xylanase
VAGNVGLDYLWFAADPWERELADRIQAFFAKEGIGKHYSKYKIDGRPVASANYQSTGLVAGKKRPAAVRAAGLSFDRLMRELFIP